MLKHGTGSVRRRKEHRLVFDMVSEADITIEVLDARYPVRCRSRLLEDFARSKHKPLVLCINKSDLIPREVAAKWKEFFSRDFPTVHVSSHDRNGTTILRKTIFEAIIGYFQGKPSEEHPLTACIVGYPNVGKSSLINVLSGRKAAPVSSHAGYTRTLRRVKVTPKLFLIDTPGVTPEDGLDVKEKVYLSTVNPEDLEDPDLIVDYLFQQAILFHQTEGFEQYLKCPLNVPTENILEQFALSRGMIRHGKGPQIEEAARIIIRDFCKGKISYYEDPIIFQEQIAQKNIK